MRKHLTAIFKIKNISGIFFLILHLNAIAQNKPSLNFSEGLAPQKDKSKNLYGFVNQKGKLVIPYQFDTVYTKFCNGFAGVGKDKKAGVIDKKGKVVVPFTFKEVGEVSKTVIPVKINSGLWGFYNHAGEKISEPVYQNYRHGGKGKVIVQKEGKWGIINDKGHQLVYFNYKGIQFISDRTYHLWKITSWAVRNNKNEKILFIDYDSLKYVGDGMWRFSLIGKQGLVDSKGNMLVGTEYDEIHNFKYGLSKVKKNKYGIINKEAKIIVPFEYDEILIDSLYIRVKTVEKLQGVVKEKWGLYTHKGEVLIKPKYSVLNEVSDGFFAARRENDSWGYVDAFGNTEIIFRFAFAEDFKDGLARVKVPYSLMKKDLYAIIDKKGEYIITPADYYFYTLGLINIDKQNKIEFDIPEEKYSSYEKINDRYIRVMREGKYGMINSDGIEIIPPIYDFVSTPSNEGLFIVELGNKSGIIDSRGNFTYRLSSRFEKIYGFKGGFSKIKLKEKYGFIDPLGNVWISAQYPDAGEMSDSMVNVKIKEKWAFLDYKEGLKVQPYYDEVQPFKNGVALVKENGKWNIINKEGKKLHKSDVDNITETKTGRYLLMLNDKFGLADKRGREILAIKYEKMEELGNGYVMVKKNGLWGVLDYNENFIIPIEHDIIIYEPANNTFVTGVVGKKEEVQIK